MTQRYAMCALRIVLGFYFLYAGVSKIINPAWSAAGYLTHASTFSGFYSWLASPELLPIVNIVNEWGLFLIGLALILGIFVRWASWLGVVYMMLYYFPVLAFPKVGEHAYIIDEHIIYAAAFLVLGAYYRQQPEWFKRACGMCGLRIS